MAEENQNDTFHIGTRRTLKFDVTGEDTLALDPTGLTFKWTVAKISEKTGNFSKTPKLEKTSAGLDVTVSQEVIATVNHTFVRVELYKADYDTWTAGDYQQQLESFSGTGEPIMLAEGVLTLLRNMTNA